MELECERLRREEVECQADHLRKELHQQMLNLEASQEELQIVRSLYCTSTSINGDPQLRTQLTILS